MIIKNIIFRMRIGFYFYLLKNNYYARGTNVLKIIITYAIFEDSLPLPTTDAESSSELEADSLSS